MTRETSRKFWQSVGRHGPFKSSQYPNVSMAEIEYWHPKSVFKSLLDYANWIGKLKISAKAKQLTRLRGRAFCTAVQEILNCE